MFHSATPPALPGFCGTTGLAGTPMKDKRESPINSRHLPLVMLQQTPRGSRQMISLPSPFCSTIPLPCSVRLLAMCGSIPSRRRESARRFFLRRRKSVIRFGIAFIIYANRGRLIPFAEGKNRLIAAPVAYRFVNAGCRKEFLLQSSTRFQKNSSIE